MKAADSMGPDPSLLLECNLHNCNSTIPKPCYNPKASACEDSSIVHGSVQFHITMRQVHQQRQSHLPSPSLCVEFRLAFFSPSKPPTPQFIQFIPKNGPAFSQATRAAPSETSFGWMRLRSMNIKMSRASCQCPSQAEIAAPCSMTF